MQSRQPHGPAWSGRSGGRDCHDRVFDIDQRHEVPTGRQKSEVNKAKQVERKSADRNPIGQVQPINQVQSIGQGIVDAIEEPLFD